MFNTPISFFFLVVANESYRSVGSIRPPSRTRPSKSRQEGRDDVVVHSEITTILQEPGKVTRVKAIRAYTAEKPDHLTFPLGAVMFIVKQVDAQYFLGTAALLHRSPSLTSINRRV